MSSGQKLAFSFLTTLVLFAGFVFFAQTGLMAQIETKFYAQAKIAEKNSQLEKLSQSCNSYISDILSTIQTGQAAYLKSSAVKTYVHQNPSEKDATERKNLTAALFDNLEAYGLDGIRLIEKNGRTLHYSSYESDVLKKLSLSTTYKLYNDIVKDSGELEAETLLVDSDKPENKLLLDKKQDRLIISFPFYITDNTYFASLVCYFDIHKFEQLLTNQGLISLAEGLSLITDENTYTGGFVLGLPKNGQSEFDLPVTNSWNKNKKSQEPGLERILQKDDGSYWLLMTSPIARYFKLSAVYSSSLFELPRELEYLIYISVFITLLLLSALLFNLKRDYLTVIKTRIKKVQFGIINEYLENKEKVEWSQIARQLENRKAELSEEIKKTIGGKSKKYSKQVDAYLDSSWQDIIGILKAQNGVETNLGGATIEEIRRVIEDVLKTSKLNVNVASAIQQPAAIDQPLEEVEEVEALDEAKPLEEVEALDEVEEIEEVEALDEVEDVEEAEEAEEVEALDEAEPLEEVEALDEVEEIEEVEALDEVEEVEEVPGVTEPTVVTEPVEVKPREETLEEVEEAEEVEALDEAEPLDEVEELEELETLEEADVKPEPQLPNLDSDPMRLPPYIDNDDPRFHEEFFVGRLPDQKPEKSENIEIFFQAQTPLFSLKKSDEADIIPEPEEEVAAEEVSAKDEISAEEVAAKEEVAAEAELEEISEAEEIPEAPYFAMTQFGQNEEPVIELRGDGETIIEQDGVYSIADNLSYTKVFLNQEFKMLVDSVLQK